MHFLRFKSQLTQKKIANYRKFPQEWLILSTKMIQKWPPFAYICLYKKSGQKTGKSHLCGILIPRKCPSKTHFKTQCAPPQKNH